MFVAQSAVPEEVWGSASDVHGFDDVERRPYLTQKAQMKASRIPLRRCRSLAFLHFVPDTARGLRSPPRNQAQVRAAFRINQRQTLLQQVQLWLFFFHLYLQYFMCQTHLGTLVISHSLRAQLLEGEGPTGQGAVRSQKDHVHGAVEGPRPKVVPEGSQGSQASHMRLPLRRSLWMHRSVFGLRPVDCGDTGDFGAISTTNRRQLRRMGVAPRDLNAT